LHIGALEGHRDVIMSQNIQIMQSFLINVTPTTAQLPRTAL